MKKGIFNVALFTVGAIIGSAVTWKLIKTKYEQIVQEEIDSVKEVFKQYLKEEYEENSEEELEQPVVANNPIPEYQTVLYKGEPEKVDEPYVITPDEFNEFSDYEVSCLTYYADGYLADIADNMIADIDDVVGLDSLDHFGEYEEDTVFVRNDARKTDYEITLDVRNYKDVIAQPPHKVVD